MFIITGTGISPGYSVAIFILSVFLPRLMSGNFSTTTMAAPLGMSPLTIARLKVMAFVVLFAVGLFFFASLRESNRLNNWQQRLLEWWRQIFTRAGGGEMWGDGGGGGSAGRRGRVEAMAARVSAMPVEVYVPAARLHALPVRELKARLAHRQLDAQRCLEKADFVDILRGHYSFHQTTCSICFEDFEDGGDGKATPRDGDAAANACGGQGTGADCTHRRQENGCGGSGGRSRGGVSNDSGVDSGGSGDNDVVVRVLERCHHVFHLECVDRWAFAAAGAGDGGGADATPRRAACPLCNTEL